MYNHMLYPYLDIRNYWFDNEKSDLLTTEECEDFEIIVIDHSYLSQSRLITIGIVDPKNLRTLEFLYKRFPKSMIVFVKICREGLEMAIEQLHKGQDDDVTKKDRKTMAFVP